MAYLIQCTLIASTTFYLSQLMHGHHVLCMMHGRVCNGDKWELDKTSHISTIKVSFCTINVAIDFLCSFWQFLFMQTNTKCVITIAFAFWVASSTSLVLRDGTTVSSIKARVLKQLKLLQVWNVTANGGQITKQLMQYTATTEFRTSAGNFN